MNKKFDQVIMYTHDSHAPSPVPLGPTPHDILMRAIKLNNYTTVRFLVNEIGVDLSVNDGEALKAARELYCKDKYRIWDFLNSVIEGDE